MADIDFDTSDFDAKSEALVLRVKLNTLKAVNDVGTEALRLSGFEVPIHTVDGEPGGDLQNSGHVESGIDMNNPEAIVGYNKVYAAYQHEGMRKDGSHVVKHYTNARSKKKFLEDPIRMNLANFKLYFRNLLA